MSLEVDETNGLDPAASQHLVRYDARQNTYALVVPNDPAGRAIPISYCPWCAAKFRRVRAIGLGSMSPDTCRKARNAVGMTQRQLADAIGESLATVFRYEWASRPTTPSPGNCCISSRNARSPSNGPGGSGATSSRVRTADAGAHRR